MQKNKKTEHRATRKVKISFGSVLSRRHGLLCGGLHGSAACGKEDPATTLLFLMPAVVTADGVDPGAMDTPLFIIIEWTTGCSMPTAGRARSYGHIFQFS